MSLNSVTMLDNILGKINTRLRKSIISLVETRRKRRKIRAFAKILDTSPELKTILNYLSFNFICRNM